MNKRRLLFVLLISLLTVSAVFAQFSPRHDYVWARDVAGATITIDGLLNEAVWAKAESLMVAYGVKDGNPSSGWKIMNGSGTPYDSSNAVIKFLSDKTKNLLYIAVIAKDSSVGGKGWENSDGILGGIYNRLQRAGNKEPLQQDIFITWVDSPGVGQLPNLTGGNLPSRGIVVAGASVQGLSNSDTNSSGQRVADQGWIIEMKVYLDSLGYNANSSTTDAVSMSTSIWDADWVNAQSGAIATKAWLLNEWGNSGGGTVGRVLLRNDVDVNTAVLPAYPYDLDLKNAQNYPDPVIDGNLNDSAWAFVPYFDIKQGDDLLRASYGTIGPDVSGEYVTKLTGGLTAPRDPGRCRVKMFFKNDKLYIGADINDGALSSYTSDDLFDGLQISMNVPTDSLRDGVHQMASYRFGFAVDTPGTSSLKWDAPTWQTKGALQYGLMLKSGSTINNSSDVDAGYTVEVALDLTKLGYTPRMTNKVVAVGVNYHDYDITSTDTSAYRVWWFREWPWSRTPAFVLLDNSNILTGVNDHPGTNVAREFRLYGNYPNPFNPSTKIRFTLPEAGVARLNVYTVLGQLVESSEITVRSGGMQEKTFDASRLASGVYYYRVEFVSQQTGAKQITETKKMVLLK